VAVGYSLQRNVLRNITLRIDPDDRIGLLGSNGNGKSTFAKLIHGKLKPNVGALAQSPRMTIGYFAQHQMDELADGRTPFDYVTDLMPDRTVADRRARIGAVGFGATLADSKCSTLSGGEKARLLFFIATFHAPHVLILDEPTNHLDMDSRESLIRAINDYQGAVILISHDKHMIEACVDRLLLVDKGTVNVFDGDLDDYAKLVLSRTAEIKPAQQPKPVTEREPPKRAKSVHKQVQEIDNKMLILRDKLKVLDEALADHTIYSEEPKKAADFARLRAKLGSDLESLENQWLELMDGVDA
jgi:ATP-binding cassette, subfamily F, member 3